MVNSFGSIATLQSCTITLNQSLAGAGGAGANGGVAGAGGVNNSYASVLTIQNSTLSDNRAQGGAAGTSGQAGPGQGGAIEDETLGVLTVIDTTIADNQALGGTGRGGGIFTNITATLRLRGATITANTASSTGGGVYLAFGALATRDSATTITGNQAPTAVDVSGLFWPFRLLTLLGF